LPSTFGIVDLFAGPGGLGEGFASLVEDGHAPFRIGISVEKEASAHRTLTLRAFLREYRARHGVLPKEFIDFHAGLASEPDLSAVDAEAWQHAIDEACALARLLRSQVDANHVQYITAASSHRAPLACRDLPFRSPLRHGSAARRPSWGPKMSG